MAPILSLAPNFSWVLGGNADGLTASAVSHNGVRTGSERGQNGALTSAPLDALIAAPVARKLRVLSPWSSYPFYLAQPSARPDWLRVERLLGEWHIPQDSPAGREQFAARMEFRRKTEDADEAALVESGWFVGSERFRQELMAQVEACASPRHRGPDIHESGVAKAERILQEEMQSRSWTVPHLQARLKGDGQKIAIASRLRRETTMTLEWIARRLHMGTASHLACLLYRHQNRAAKTANTLF